MIKFNSLVTTIIENNTTSMLHASNEPSTYAAGDNRPIDPVNTIIGIKKKNKKNKIPLYRRVRAMN